VSLTPFTLLVFGIGPFLSTSATLSFFLFLCLFGAAAAVEFPALGGASAPPAAAFLPFLAWRAFRARGATAYFRRVPRSGVWLMALVAWGVVSALVIPRVLAGQVDVLTIDRSSALFEVVLYPLRPVSGNITQACYAVCDLVVFLAVRELLAAPGRLRGFRDAVLWLAALDAFAALLNLLEYYAGLPAVLPYVRTGGYQIYDSYELGGLVRIQGTFAEASHFANFTLPLFAFCFATWLYTPERPRFAGLLSVVLLGLLVASTSSTAYSGLVIYLSIIAGQRASTILSRRLVPRVRTPALVIGALVTLAAGLALLDTNLFQSAYDYFDSVLLRKLQTSSGEDRMALNRQAWQNFVDTYGLGVGLGTARASSFPFVLLSNLGALGALLFGGFLYQVFRSRSAGNGPVNAVARAGGHALVAALAGALASGFVFDLGVAFYAFAAAAASTSLDLAVAPAKVATPRERELIAFDTDARAPGAAVASP
jgi:hypothetical protein